ncbi:MAG: hypothetical protein OEM46_05990 [Ignavibacteria bacterium]|nr:hypothetical protein [Ignavibacteria bacterium]
MKKNNILSFIFGFLALASGSIWFGAYIARLLTLYQMFEPTELTLKNFVTNNNLPAIIQTISPIVYLTFFSYVVLILTFTLFIILTKLKLKENGWLFIISMIIYLTLPLEAILLMTDFKLILLFINNQFASEEVLKLMIERITLLSSFPIILLLSYLSIPFFLVVKPFTIKSKDEN